MPIRILMPALSPSMKAGTLATWLVGEGDAVTPGMVIAEIETDAATMEVEAVEAGVIGRILVPAGTRNVLVDAPIAVLVLPGEAAGVRRGGSTARNDASTLAAPERVHASPIARRLAREHGVDLASVSGTGPQGRIVRRDIESAAAGIATNPSARLPSEPTPDDATLRRQVATTRPAPGLPSPADQAVLDQYEMGSFELVPHNGMRRTIAERVTRSKATIPHFYLSLDCRIDEMLRARERMNGASPARGARAYKLSINDFLIKAMALALQHVPAANVTWLDGGIVRHKASDVGVAVAIDGGLYVPVIRHAELKSLSEISNEMKELAERARQRRLGPHEYQGGTTSISNLGRYGIKSFDAVIYPPHATILAVGAAARQPVVAGDRIEVGTVMSCTLACDHRAIDGAVGAELLAAFKLLIEDPVRMLV